MRISGFTFVRNASKLFYPVKPSIESILPLVDEFVVALGPSDDDDHTYHEILSIQSDKIRIIQTTWDLKTYHSGMEYARQTDIAMKACTGDWLFYLQCDEVVHEKYLSVIKARLEELNNHSEVEGLLFHYRHFWGDFNHYIVSRAWYPKEIRIVRNLPDIHSWRDAQSFRMIPSFDGKSYYQKKGTRKLRVATVDAFIHHYGFVRPPEQMQKKRKNHSFIYRPESTRNSIAEEGDLFHYGDLRKHEVYSDSHPVSMQEWVKLFNWQSHLQPDYKPANRQKHKHERFKYRVLTWLEQKILQGRRIGGFRNYTLLNK